MALFRDTVVFKRESRIVRKKKEIVLFRVPADRE
jgi:hypothetical protein